MSNRPRIVLGLQPEIRQRFFTDDLIERLKAVGEVTEAPTQHFDDWTPLRDELHQADIVMLGWHSPTLEGEITADDPLKCVVHSGGSIRAIVPKELLERGVRASSQTAENAVPVAEYTTAMIMLAAKDTFRAGRLYQQRRGKVEWMQDFPNVGLFRSNIGLIGLSRISRLVIKMLKPYGVNIFVYSRHLSDEEAAELGVKTASIEQIMENCTVISLHSADVPKNRHMINADNLKLIKPGATFINTARGRLVDQDALIEELRDGRFDAILDVADPDVTVADSPLWDMDNVLLTPHFAGSAGREMLRLGEGAVINVEEFVQGKEKLTGEITVDDYDGMA